MGEKSIISEQEVNELHEMAAELRNLKQSILESPLKTYFPKNEMSFHNQVVFAISNLVNSKQSFLWIKASEYKTDVPIFRPYRKKSDDNEWEYDYGEIYITEDFGRIFLDINNERTYEHQSDDKWKDYEILNESVSILKKDELLQLIKYIRKTYKPSGEVWRDHFRIAELSDEGVLNMYGIINQ